MSSGRKQRAPRDSAPTPLQIYRGRLVGEWFRSAIETHRRRTGLPVTNADAARLVGVAPSLMGVYLNDCYDNSAARIKLPGDDVLERASEKLSAPYLDAVARRYALLDRYGSDPTPAGTVVVHPGDVLTLYRPDGKKVTLTPEVIKRLGLEAELQEGGEEEP